MPRPPSDAEQIALRVPKKWIEQADELAELLSRPGIPTTRTDAFRAAIARGLEVLFSELKPAPAPEPSKVPKRR